VYFTLLQSLVELNISRSSGIRSLRGLAIPLCLGAACAAPMTQVGSVTREQVQSEEVRQQQLVVESQIKQQARLDDVALPLLRSAVPLCGSAVTIRAGFRFTSRSYFSDDYVRAAQAMGLTDTAVISSVTSGSAAERAGLRVDDRFLSVGGARINTDENTITAVSKRLPAGGRALLPIVVRRDSIVRTVNVPADTVCAYNVVVLQSNELNAFADGKNVYVTSRMVQFAADDDELATVVSHEIAHNAMHHMDAVKTNAAIGAILGAIVDIAMAKQGINTGGSYTNDFAKLGSMVYSQDFEREADYVGLYILAGADRPISKAPNLWRRFAIESPNSIKFASSHPTTAERFVRLDQWRAEIERKVALGGPFGPEMKNGVSGRVTQLARASDRSQPGGVAERPAQVVASTPRRDTITTPRRAGSAIAPAVSGTQRSLTPQSSSVAPATDASSPAKVLSKRTPRSDDHVAIAIVGAPASDSDRVAGIKMFEVGKTYFDRHEWAQAEEYLEKALLLDGSVAAYHAKLGEVEMVLGHWEEAEAEYTAASLIDVDNPEYRAQIKEARRRKA